MTNWISDIFIGVAALVLIDIHSNLQFLTLLQGVL